MAAPIDFASPFYRITVRFKDMRTPPFEELGRGVSVEGGEVVFFPFGVAQGQRSTIDLANVAEVVISTQPLQLDGRRWRPDDPPGP